MLKQPESRIEMKKNVWQLQEEALALYKSCRERSAVAREAHRVEEERCEKAFRRLVRRQAAVVEAEDVLRGWEAAEVRERLNY